MLIVFDNFDSEFAENPQLQKLIRFLHARIFSGLPRGKILGPWLPPEQLAKRNESYICFADLFQDLGLREGNFPEFLELTQMITSALAEAGDPAGSHVAYALTAPHTEALPFKILGLEKILKSEDGVLLLRPYGLHGEIISELCRHKSVPLETRLSFWCICLSLVVSLQKCGSLIKEILQTLLLALKAGFSGSSKEVKSGTVLLIANRERSLRYLKPVQVELAAMRRESITVGGIRGSGGLGLSKETAVTIFASDYMKAWEPVTAFFRTAISWALASRKIRRLSLRFHGVNLISVYFPQMRRIYLTKGLLANAFRNSSIRLLAATKPSALFSSDPAELSSTLFSAARPQKIPSLLYACMDNGLPSSSQVWRANLIGDRILTLNEHLRNYLATAPEESRPVRMVGDVLIAPPGSPESTHEVIEKLRHDLRLSPGKPIILLLSRHVSEALTLANKELLFRSAFAVARDLEASLILKCHPHERIESTRVEIARWGLDIPIIPPDFKYSLRDISRASALVCNFPGSSSSIEAMIAGTPVLVIGTALQVEQYNSVENAAAFVRWGAVAWAANAPDAVKIARSIFENQKIRHELQEKAAAFLLHYQGNTDGLAARRIAEEISTAISS